MGRCVPGARRASSPARVSGTSVLGDQGDWRYAVKASCLSIEKRSERHSAELRRTLSAPGVQELASRENGPLCLADRTTLDDMHQEQYDGDHEKDVQQATERVAGDYSNEPQYQQKEYKK